MTRLGFASIAAAFLAASPAAAQLAPGRSGHSSTHYMGNEEAMGELASFGRCYAKKNRPEALSLLATRPSSREEAEVYRKLFKSDGLLCLSSGVSLSMSLAYVRGSIAEGLYRAGGPFPGDFMQEAPVASAVRNLSDAARCYAGGHNEQVQALLATRVSSKAEYKAVAGLMDDFGACMPAGVQVQFDATVIRYRLAEAQLRLGRTAPPSGN